MALTQIEKLFPDGSEFHQKAYGDCQSLVVVDGLLKCSGGKEHLNSLITTNPDGNYTVTFPGRKPVDVTKTELYDEKLADTNSPGVKILEKATVKVHAETNSVPDPFKLYMGKEQGKSYLLDLSESKAELRSLAGTAFSGPILKQVENGDAIAVGHIFNKNNGITDLDGNHVDLPSHHAYTLFAKGDHLEFENPWDSNKRVKISNDNAASVFQNIIVAPAPGKKLDIDPGLKRLAEASADASVARNNLNESKGAWSLNGDAARGGKNYDIPADPKLLKKDDEAMENLRKVTAQTDKAIAQGKIKLQPPAPEPKPEPTPTPIPKPEQEVKPEPTPQPTPTPPPEPKPEPTPQPNPKPEPVPTPTPAPAPQPTPPAPSPKPAPAPQPARKDYIKPEVNDAIAKLDPKVREQVETLRQQLSDGKSNDGKAVRDLTGKSVMKDNATLNRSNSNNLVQYATKLAQDGNLSDKDKEDIANKAKEYQGSQNKNNVKPSEIHTHHQHQHKTIELLNR